MNGTSVDGSDVKGLPLFSSDHAFILSWRRIFERLEQHGYAREIGYFDYCAIEGSRKSDFESCEPLTDKGQLP